MKEKILKYLKTICLWILIVCFITSFATFITNLDSYLRPTKIAKNPTEDSLVLYSKDIEEDLNKLTGDLKDVYGENYPALGIVYYKAILHYSSETVVQNFLFSLIGGFALGNIIYFVFIAKYKKYKLFICLVLALFVTAIFFSLSDIFTNYANNEKLEFTVNNIFWNMEVTSIPYIIISIILIVVQKIYSTYVEIRNS